MARGSHRPRARWKDGASVIRASEGLARCLVKRRRCGPEHASRASQLPGSQQLRPLYLLPRDRPAPHRPSFPSNLFPCQHPGRFLAGWTRRSGKGRAPSQTDQFKAGNRGSQLRGPLHLPAGSRVPSGSPARAALCAHQPGPSLCTADAGPPRLPDCSGRGAPAPGSALPPSPGNPGGPGCAPRRPPDPPTAEQDCQG